MIVGALVVVCTINKPSRPKPWRRPAPHIDAGLVEDRARFIAYVRETSLGNGERKAL
jgi:hypothetical protein